MDCRESLELMQRWLDGEPVDSDRTDWAGHVTTCPECRDWYAAAQCLRDGIRRLAPPRPPAGLAERISQQVLSERRRVVRIRRLLTATGVAAGLLVACGTLYLGSRGGPSAAQQAGLRRSQPAPALPSLNRSLEEASLAVVSLTRRTADETMTETRLLLPAKLAPAVVVDSHELERLFAPPAEPLREIQEGMTAGLEPVTTSARRALGFFLSRGQGMVGRGVTQ